MNAADHALLDKLGINITNLEYTHNEIQTGLQKHPGGEPVLTTRGTFYIDEDRFRPMCHLIRITDMIVESKNPAVSKMYEQLVTMLHLTEEKK